MSVRSLRVAFVLSLCAISVGACSSAEKTDSTAAAAGTVAQSVTTSDAATKTNTTFARYTVSPEGRIDGLLLGDGTMVRLHPGVAIAADALTEGDAVHVEGTRITTPTGAIVVRPTVTKGSTVIVDLSMMPEPPKDGMRGKGHPGPPPFGARPGPGEGLVAVTATGTVTAIVSRPSGEAEALILSDGTTARLPHHMGDATPTFAVGDAVLLTGHGATSAYGKGMIATTASIGGGETQRLAPEPPTVTPLSLTGEIARVIVNPFGGVDSLLMKDGTQVRVPPFASRSALTVGTKVQITGKTVGKMAHADRITSTTGAVLVEVPSEPPASPPPRVELTSVTADGAITTLRSGPSGDVETLLLADGSTVKVHPGLSRKIAASLIEGARVHVSGKGGRYDGVVSMFAESVTLPSGEVVTAPEGIRHHGPPPPF